MVFSPQRETKQRATSPRRFDFIIRTNTTSAALLWTETGGWSPQTTMTATGSILWPVPKQICVYGEPFDGDLKLVRVGTLR
jgi:hypothetical protein